VFGGRDALAELNGATVHLDCLNARPFGSAALSKLAAYRDRAFAGPSKLTGEPDEESWAVTAQPLDRVGIGVLLLALCVGVGVVWGRKSWHAGTTTVHATAIVAYLFALAVGVHSGLSTYRQILVMSLAPSDAVARLKRSRERNRRWAWPSTFLAVAVVGGRLASNAWANLSVSLIGAFCTPAIILMMAAWVVRYRNDAARMQ
jgi:hypothetical protein